MAIGIEWEKFLGGPTPPLETRMHVTLTRQMRIHLNENMFRLLGKPEAVCLLFNRREQKIALQPTSPRLNEAFPVLKYGKIRNTYNISVAPFCRHHGIALSATHKFISPHLSQDGKLILNLNETIIVSRNRRK